MDVLAIENMTFKHFPEAAVRDLLRGTFTAHKDAWQRCAQEYASPEAENMLGFDRRARLEGLMRAVAERHERHGITATVKKQEGQPWNHTELSNGPVILTAATVQSPLEMVDPSEYRQSLASSPQLKFSPFEEPKPANGRLYVLLLHSRAFPDPPQDRDYGFLPGSAYLAYPNSELSFYRHSINLFDRFPEVVKAMTPEEWDEGTLRRYIERARRVYKPRRSKSE